LGCWRRAVHLAPFLGSGCLCGHKAVTPALTASDSSLSMLTALRRGSRQVPPSHGSCCDAHRARGQAQSFGAVLRRLKHGGRDVASPCLFSPPLIGSCATVAAFGCFHNVCLVHLKSPGRQETKPSQPRSHPTNQSTTCRSLEVGGANHCTLSAGFEAVARISPYKSIHLVAEGFESLLAHAMRMISAARRGNWARCSGGRDPSDAGGSDDIPPPRWLGSETRAARAVRHSRARRSRLGAVIRRGAAASERGGSDTGGS